jgi:cbb3-type cytochrome oxidase subunit 3
MLQEFLAARGMGIFPAAALLIFLLCFAAVLVHLLTGRRDRYDRMADLPLQDEETGTAEAALPRGRSSR